MGKQRKQMHSEMTNDYMIRSLHNRFGTLSKATMAMVGYYMSPPFLDDQTTAEGKVDGISLEIFSGDSLVLGYIMGSVTCRTALFAKIDAISEVTYPHFDTDAKEFLKTELTPS